MTDPITEARDLVEGHNFSQTEEKIVAALLDEAEKWQAMAIDEKAWNILFARSRKTKNDQIQPSGMDYEQAARELAAEAGNWRKIGVPEKEAIEAAIAFRSELDCKQVDVLRKLLDGLQ